MELMGHANIETTRRIYTHLRQKKRKGVADILNKKFSEIAVKDVVKNEETADNTKWT
jgi:site-specific recombinase XerD